LVIFLHATNTFFNQANLGVVSDGQWTVSDSQWLIFGGYKSLALCCVPLFVMLTGALLLQPSKLNEPIRVFLKKRGKRIGLAFVFWTIIYLVWSFYITNTPLTLDNLTMGTITSFFTGAYYHFWYLYLIAGLYLIAPLLRAGIAYKEIKLIRYLVRLWFLSICLIPLLPLFTGYGLNGEVFIMSGFSGYFLLGAYLQQNQLRRRYMNAFLLVGFVFTFASTAVMTYRVPSIDNDFVFFDYLSVNVVLMSIGVYAFLSTFSFDWPGTKHPYLKKIIETISKNTLPIFLLHVIVLETLSRGLLGFTLNLSINPLIEVPLASVAILFITLGIILLMKKVPILKKLIG